MTVTELQWPDLRDAEGWATLANTTFQLATMQADIAENRAWSAFEQDLVTRQLSYAEFIAARHEALSARMKRRKCDQANLRYRFGFRQGRRPRRLRLVRDAIRETLGPIFAK